MGFAYFYRLQKFSLLIYKCNLSVNMYAKSCFVLVNSKTVKNFQYIIIKSDVRTTKLLSHTTFIVYSICSAWLLDIIVSTCLYVQ